MVSVIYKLLKSINYMDLLLNYFNQTDPIQLIIELYLGAAGALGLIFALSAFLYTTYKLVHLASIKKTIFFLVVCVLIFFGTKADILPWVAAIILMSNGLFYMVFMGRFVSFKWKVKTKKSEENPSVAILIPAKNEALVIQETLEHLNELEYPEDKLRIIVINDNSNDETLEICIEMLSKIPSLEIVNNKKSLGKSVGLNKVISNLDDEYAVILDADHHMSGSWLKMAISRFTSKDIIGVQGKSRVRNEKSSLLAKMCYIENLFRYEVVYSGRSIGVFMGSGAIFKTACLKEVNGFSPDSLTEDLDITYRFYEKGYRMVFENGIETYDLAPPNIKNYYSQRLRWFRGSWVCFVQYFKQLFSGKTMPLATRLQLLNLMIENLTLIAMLYLYTLYFLGLIGVFQFNFTPFVFIKVIVMTLIMLTACIKTKSFKALLVMPMMNFYFMLYAFPNIMAMINAWILKTNAVWVKTERSREPNRVEPVLSSNQ